ncbi:hypothetical protein QTH89_22165 [Variovorax sp. J22G21]|uniref:hypothetical protein n=1 Tax=Variovorax fucosicus TaxID=3053517 RepID=UPI002578B21A|nr:MULTISPECIES: hypothetical protein [unclassified Variovorax]MDM0039157.1 hypothetical protein [Variovorax sp. J22R193]MDM0063933.1 hypothetical protein [Variovorax sp. J22G21]
MIRTTTTTITRLQRGETLHMPLDAHTTLQVAAGEVIVREPLRWLGDTVVAPVATLSEGRSHRLQNGGWVELRALGDGAEVRSHRPMSALHALYAAWQTLWRRATLSPLHHPTDKEPA